MHYKNGREAKNGDLVIGKSEYQNAPVMSGLLIDINPGATSCNGQLLRPGGAIQTCVTVGDFFHAEDAVACIEAEWAKSKAALEGAK